MSIYQYQLFQPIQYVLHEDDDGRGKKGPSNVSFDAMGSNGEVS